MLQLKSSESILLNKHYPAEQLFQLPLKGVFLACSVPAPVEMRGVHYSTSFIKTHAKETAYSGPKYTAGSQNREDCRFT